GTESLGLLSQLGVGEAFELTGMTLDLDRHVIGPALHRLQKTVVEIGHGRKVECNRASGSTGSPARQTSFLPRASKYSWRTRDMQTGHEFFIHELKDMLDAEQQLVEALGKQAEESQRPELKKAFESHQAQTEKQVERLQQVFESIGEEPEKAECAGIRGLIEEHENFKQEDPSEDLLDIFNVGAATKVEK